MPYVIRLLLDTHIWLWGILEPTRLSRKVTEVLESKDAELWLSPVSIWELTMLRQKRRLLIDEEVGLWLRNAFDIRSFREAPFTFEVALEVAALKLPHRDPADHFLVATAKVFDLTLVTADKHLQKVPGLSVLPN